jgi:hypothetical protein
MAVHGGASGISDAIPMHDGECIGIVCWDRSGGRLSGQPMSVPTLTSK